jgi:predicted metal-dependent HD superfamily phosphohydrolase
VFKEQQLAITLEHLYGANELELQTTASKQAQFLQIFQKKARIYRTPEAYEEFERQARENIARFYEEFAVAPEASPTTE